MNQYQNIVNSMDTLVFYQQGQQHSIAKIPKMNKSFLLSFSDILEFKKTLPEKCFKQLIDLFYDAYEAGYDEVNSKNII